MSEPSAISAPDAGPGDSSLTSNEKTSGSIQHRHEEIVKASIEIDNDNTSFRRLDNNKSPSELSESNTGGPVSYLPPPPKYDPSGFYTHGKSYIVLLKTIPTIYLCRRTFLLSYYVTHTA